MASSLCASTPTIRALRPAYQVHLHTRSAVRLLMLSLNAALREANMWLMSRESEELQTASNAKAFDR